MGRPDWALLCFMFSSGQSPDDVKLGKLVVPSLLCDDGSVLGLCSIEPNAVQALQNLTLDQPCTSPEKDRKRGSEGDLQEAWCKLDAKKNQNLFLHQRIQAHSSNARDPPTLKSPERQLCAVAAT